MGLRVMIRNVAWNNKPSLQVWETEGLGMRLPGSYRGSASDIVSLICRMLHIAETDIASTLSGILIGAISGG